jgi:hypothetical protein
VTAYSPVTNKTYAMTCVAGSERAGKPFLALRDELGR